MVEALKSVQGYDCALSSDTTDLISEQIVKANPRKLYIIQTIDLVKDGFTVIIAKGQEFQCNLCMYPTKEMSGLYITKANEQRLHITQTITAAIKVKDDCAVVNKERGRQYKYKMEDEVVKLKVS
eukprot:scaffold80264_cov73-Cyclotella_meneghiniana.AAC.1